MSTAVAATTVGDTLLGIEPSLTKPKLTDPMRRRAFERWMLPHREALGRQALRFTRDRESAEDLVQETLLQAYSKLDLFRPVARVSTSREADDRAAQAWLQAILRNRFFNDYRRRRAAPPAVSLDGLEELVSAANGGQGKDLTAAMRGEGAGYRGDPASCVLAEAERAAALRALAALPDRYRVPVLMVDIDGRTYQDVSATLGLPINTLRSRLHRGRNLLKRRLIAWRGLPSIDRN